jgi:hypothetical protein
MDDLTGRYPAAPAPSPMSGNTGPGEPRLSMTAEGSPSDHFPMPVLGEQVAVNTPPINWRQPSAAAGAGFTGWVPAGPSGREFGQG